MSEGPGWVFTAQTRPRELLPLRATRAPYKWDTRVKNLSEHLPIPEHLSTWHKEPSEHHTCGHTHAHSRAPRITRGQRLKPPGQFGSTTLSGRQTKSLHFVVMSVSFFLFMRVDLLSLLCSKSNTPLPAPLSEEDHI